MLIALLTACSGGSLDLVDEEVPRPPEPAVALTAAEVFDPLLGGPLEITWTTTGPGTLTLTVEDAAGAAVYSGTGDGGLSWDGRNTQGMPLPVGPYQLVAELALAEGGSVLAELPTTLVRVGVDAVYAEDDGGATAQRVPLYWHGDKELQDLSAPIAALASLEDAEGLARDLPPIAKGLNAQTADLGQPTAWTWDSRPILSFTLGRSELHGGTGLEYAELGLEVAGWTVLSGLPLTEGQAVVLQKDTPLGEGLGVLEEPLRLSFTYTDADGVVRSLGQQRLPVRLYALLGPPTFGASAAIYNPWVAAVDPALRGIAGAGPDHDAVTDALVRWIFEDLGLEYDTRYGASAYVSYEGDWTDAHFRFGSFLDRKYGSVINCTDAASILLTYANMLGAEQYYRIILENFELNEILAIGGDEFTSCPFGRGGCGFSYHAITADAEGAQVWDATLAEDGDADPGASPSEVLLVQGLDEDEYLWRLDRSGHATTHYLAQGTMQ